MKLRATLVLLALVAAFSACQMTAEVTTSVSAGGRATFGFVLAFDKEILDAAAKTDEGKKAIEGLDRLPAELKEGDWTFRASRPAGGFRIETRRQFGSVDSLNRALDELRRSISTNSPATSALIAVFKEFEVQRRPGFLKSETRVSGRLNVSLATLLGQTANVTTQQQQAVNELLALPQASQFLKFRVRADLPGRVTSSTGSPAIKGGSVTWTPTFGKELPFSATASAYNPFVLLIAGMLAAALLAALVVYLVRRRGPRRAVPGWEVGVPGDAEPASAETGGGTTLPPGTG